MSSELEVAVEVLLAHSLDAWRVCANISREADGGLLIVAADKRVHIARAPPNLPFRWAVADAERTRGASSVTGVLRHVRAALDPNHRSVRLRIEPLPPASS